MIIYTVPVVYFVVLGNTWATPAALHVRDIYIAEPPRLPCTFVHNASIGAQSGCAAAVNMDIDKKIKRFCNCHTHDATGVAQSLR